MCSDQLNNKTIEMIDVSRKPVMYRIAEAIGEINLKLSTIDAIKKGQIKKGDVLTASKIVGILAVKKTADILPLCHSIPLQQVNINFEFLNNTLKSHCVVSANYKTGVEMEALVGVTTSLLNVWDMVKYLEKDDSGQYPDTVIKNIRVIKKWKKSI